MKIYTNDTQMRYYINNDSVKGLTAIEVGGLEDAIMNYPDLFTLEVLIDQHSLQKDDLGEIKITKSLASAANFGFIAIPFLKDLSYAEIIKKFMDLHDGVHQKINILSDASEYIKPKIEWDGDIETVTLSPSDRDILVVTIDHFEATVETLLTKHT